MLTFRCHPERSEGSLVATLLGMTGAETSVSDAKSFSVPASPPRASLPSAGSPWSPSLLRRFLLLRHSGRKSRDPPLQRLTVVPLQPAQHSFGVGRDDLGVVEREPRVHLPARIVARAAALREDRADRRPERIGGPGRSGNRGLGSRWDSRSRRLGGFRSLLGQRRSAHFGVWRSCFGFRCCWRLRLWGGSSRISGAGRTLWNEGRARQKGDDQNRSRTHTVAAPASHCGGCRSAGPVPATLQISNVNGGETLQISVCWHRACGW